MSALNPCAAAFSSFAERVRLLPHAPASVALAVIDVVTEEDKNLDDDGLFAHALLVSQGLR